jgi:HD domain
LGAFPAPGIERKRITVALVFATKLGARMTRLLADDVVSTDAERACLKALREATRMADGPMERHCLRVFVIAERLAAELDRRVDREVLLSASLLHDVGAYGVAPEGDAYTSEGRRFAAQLLDPFGWTEIRVRACGDAIEHHHELTEMWELSRGWLRGLFTAVPREGIYGEIARIAAGIVRERPETIPDIFGGEPYSRIIGSLRSHT